ncbi:MAG: ABC transporter permease [Mycobacteriales bacterium]
MGTSGAQPEAVLQGVAGLAIEGRSLGQIAWLRLKRDKIAIGGGITVAALCLIALLAPVIVHFLGHPPNANYIQYINPNTDGPIGAFGGISTHFLLGIEPVFGRDVFSRIVYGAQVSLLVAFSATLLSVVIGVVAGITAGYFGGFVDTAISRVMDLLLTFPILLFAIAIVAVVDINRILLLVLVIGFFNWPYIGRIIRGQTLSLREKEFIDAARSLGARSWHIMFRELLPNLIAPILVYSTLVVPTNILFEAGLSFLGVGVIPPQASWGQMLSEAVNYYTFDPEFMIVPGVALFITVMAFNLFGDGLRDALDPRTGRG